MGFFRQAKGVVREFERSLEMPDRRSGRAFFVVFRGGAMSMGRQFVLFRRFPVCLMHGIPSFL